MIRHEKDGIVYFEFDSLAGNGRIQHAVFSRKGGVSQRPFDSLNLSVSVPDNKANVHANRERAYGLMGRSNETVVHAHLVHGCTIATVSQQQNGTWVEYVDGLLTNEAGCALTMNYADCAPIFLYDPIQHAIGLGHAGWKGAVKDVPGEMVRQMEAEFGSVPATLLAAVGPCISAAHYEVGEEVITAVKEAFANPDSLLLPSPTNGKRPHFDLTEANRRNLWRAGVKNIELSGFCTAERTDLFFSHRSEKGKTGRFGTLFILN